MYASFEIEMDREIEVARHGNFLVLLLVGLLSALFVGSLGGSLGGFLCGSLSLSDPLRRARE